MMGSTPAERKIPARDGDWEAKTMWGEGWLWLVKVHIPVGRWVENGATTERTAGAPAVVRSMHASGFCAGTGI